MAIWRVKLDMAVLLILVVGTVVSPSLVPDMEAVQRIMDQSIPVLLTLNLGMVVPAN